MCHQIHTYSELRQQIHDDLRMQRPAFHRRNARQQSKLFARWNQSLIHSPNSNRLCFKMSAMISQYRFTRDKFRRFLSFPRQ